MSVRDVIAFYDERTSALGGSDDVRHGTVTEEQAVVRLRDRLEKAHFARVVPLTGRERVLDLGGGAGRFALWLAPKVREVVLVDGSAELLDVASRRAAREAIENVRVVHAALPGGFEPEPAGFDILLVSGLAVHLDDDELEELARLVTRALGPGGRFVLKEPVTADGQAREDRRFDERGRTTYLARFRPRERYVEVFGRSMPLLYARPTCAHPIPFFLGGTEEAARSVGSGKAARVLDLVAPLWERLDPMLLELELAMRATPGLSSLLAPVPVLQDLFVFGARERPRAQGNAAPSLSVVVIAFDEEACLAAVVRELVDRLAREGIDFEVVLVDDGSRDRTLPIMRELAAHDPRLSVVALSPNRGIGGALRAGFDAARGEYVTWVPADGQIDPATVVELYRRRAEALMLTTVYVARDDALYRTWISRTLNALIRLRTGEVAKSGGNYLFHRSAWEHHAPLADDTMMISTAFRARLRAAGEAIVEVPIRARARAAGHSKVLNARTILRTLLATARLRRS